MTKIDSKDKKDVTKKTKKPRKLKGTFIDKNGKICFFTNEDIENRLIID